MIDLNWNHKPGMIMDKKIRSDQRELKERGQRPVLSSLIHAMLPTQKAKGQIITETEQASAEKTR